MKLIFKQRFFSWLDSYDIYGENGETLFTVRGELSFGHRLRIYDAQGYSIGLVQQRVFTFLPKFEMYLGDRYAGCITKRFSFFGQHFRIDCNGWQVDGDWFGWDYRIIDPACRMVATVSKQLWNFTDTYVIDVANESDALCALMLVLAIDAEKCSRNA